MRIWIDMANSPHVLFFAPIISELRRRGHQVEITARDFSQTFGLLRLNALDFTPIGFHPGKGKSKKLTKTLGRALELRRWAVTRHFDLALSHNAYPQIIAARLAKVPAVTLMDYEYQPANHIAFRLARRVVVPFTFSDRDLRHYGARKRKVRRYSGLKEEVYLTGFKPDRDFVSVFERLFHDTTGYDLEKNLLFLVRTAATMSAYHQFENPLVTKLLEHLKSRPEVRVVLLPRTDEQRQELQSLTGGTIVIPNEPLEGRNAVWHADAVISAGGTMCREAAVFGTPSYTFFWGRMGSVDRHLIANGMLQQIKTEEDFGLLPNIKSCTRREITNSVRDEVIDLCLSMVYENG
jgi:predicted glycosyltransferase